MKKILLGICMILIYLMPFAQSFEGRLVYKVEFDIQTEKFGNIEIKKEQVIEKMKKDDDYFDSLTVTIKNGNYIKEDNSNNRKRIVYKADLNKIYTFQKDFDHVVITDAKNYHGMNLNLKEPKIEQLDSLKVINGNNCNLIKLTWGKLGEEYYFYNSEIAKLDSGNFKNHNYEYFNAIVDISKSYPLEIVKKVSDFISIRMTLLAIEEVKIDDSLFELPKFEKAEKEYAEMMLKITGSEVMKIKD
ncbi:hypothetical protein [Riemerella anatipestifer]|uniref:hypothetical protein n=1 Tax=Riemerella anatipestifer TaxID=34085 RepID=UPI00069CA138|nr:hypothetical protein [Riemerella anatipestifer]